MEKGLGKYLVTNMVLHMGLLAWQVPLSSAQLEGLSEDEREQLLGTRLYGLIAIADPHGAGKVAGMLLELQAPICTAIAHCRCAST